MPRGGSEPSFWLRQREPIARALGLDLTHAQTRFGQVLGRIVRPGTRWLELGCGHQIMPDFFVPLATQREWVERCDTFVGVDADEGIKSHPLVKLRAKALGGDLPFRAGEFDLVTANMVAEHLPDPKRVLEDVRRVLRPGGKFVFHTPNYLYYLIAIADRVPQGLKNWLILKLERRPAEDVFPAHYRINTARRIRELAAETGFRVAELQVTGGGGSFLFLGPVHWLELLLLKGLQSFAGGRLQSNLIAVLERVD